MTDLFAMAGISLERPLPPPAPISMPQGDQDDAVAKAMEAASLPMAPASHVASSGEMLDPCFTTVATVMRGWTVARPGEYVGSCFANGQHVRDVVNALRRAGLIPGAPPPTSPPAGPVLRQILDLVTAGHVVLRPELGVLAQAEFAQWRAAAEAALGSASGEWTQ